MYKRQLYDTVVNQRSEDVHQQDGKHHTVGITRIQHTDNDSHHTDQEAVDEPVSYTHLIEIADSHHHHAKSQFGYCIGVLSRSIHNTHIVCRLLNSTKS